HRHPRVSRFHGRGARRRLGGGRRPGRGVGDGRSRGRDGEGVGLRRRTRRAAAGLRVPDGQGARRLREGVPPDQAAADAEGHSRGDPGGRGAGVPRHHQSVLAEVSSVQEGHEGGRGRGGGRPRRVPDPLRAVLEGADRAHRRDRRHPARGRPWRRGEGEGRGGRRDESDEAEGGADRAARGVAEKLTHLCVCAGKERSEIGELHAGDIGVVAKLRDTHTNDSLSTREFPFVLPKIPFPEPIITVAVEVKQRGEEDKLSTGLHKLSEEDPTFHHEYNAELGQTLIRGLGERHLEIVVGRLARKYGVHALVTKPKVAYRETLKGRAEGQGKHKKQTGGRGQYGDCWIRVAPLPRGSGFVFEDKIVGGVIPRSYIPAVEKG